MFFLRFDCIFEMYHMRRLDFTFVRLFALHLSYVIRKEQISAIAVLDPYLMHENFLKAGKVERDTSRKKPTRGAPFLPKSGEHVCTTTVTPLVSATGGAHFCAPRVCMILMAHKYWCAPWVDTRGAHLYLCATSK